MTWDRSSISREPSSLKTFRHSTNCCSLVPKLPSAFTDVTHRNWSRLAFILRALSRPSAVSYSITHRNNIQINIPLLLRCCSIRQKLYSPSKVTRYVLGEKCATPYVSCLYNSAKNIASFTTANWVKYRSATIMAYFDRLVSEMKFFQRKTIYFTYEALRDGAYAWGKPC